MAKSSNRLQKIFGATGSTGSISIFGSKKIGTPIYSNDLDDIQSLSAWDNGFSSALIDGTKPTLQDLNAIFYALTYQNSYQQCYGIPTYLTTQEYFIGSIVRVSGTIGTGTYIDLFISRTDHNINNALSSVTHWQLLWSNKFRSIGSSQSYTVTYDDWFLSWDLGAAQAGATITLPVPTFCPGREIWIKYVNGSVGVSIAVNVSGGGNVLMIDGTDGTSIVSCTIRYTTSIRLISNGEIWVSSVRGASAE